MTKSLQCGILIPTYNHGCRIRQVIVDSLNYIPDILVVMDGCTDDTKEQIEGLPLHCVSWPKNQGKGVALRAGFREAAKLGWDYAITMDSDGQHKASDIPKFIEAIAKNPGSIIVGDRDMSQVHVPEASRRGKSITNFWLKVETGLPISDGQSGFRAYPIAAVNHIKTWSKKYEFEIEILAKAAWRNIPIVSIPVEVIYQPPGVRITYFRPFRDVVRATILNTILVTLRCGQSLLGCFKK